MKVKLTVAGIFLLFPVLAFCQTYISNVTIVDVEQKQLLPGRTVIFEGNRIKGIFDNKVVKMRMPAGAVLIDGTGKYLMPGMTDAHVHFFQSGGLYTRPDAIDLRKYMPYEQEINWTHANMEDQLRRYIRLGITSVIDVGSTVNFLNQRDSFSNAAYAPSIYMTGPLITSYEPSVFNNLKNDEPFALVKTASEATAMVERQLPYKPDFIKIWYIARGKSPEDSARKFLPAVEATIAIAHKNNLKVAVHATERITAQLAIEAGCDYLVHSVDDEVLSDAFIALLKKKNVILCPTLIVSDNYLTTYLQDMHFTAEALKYANPKQLGSLGDLKYLADKNLSVNFKMTGNRIKAIFDKKDSIMQVNLKKIADAGVIIAAGTDAGNIGTLHGISFIDELRSMKKAGLSNWQILQAATINGARVLGKDSIFGSVRMGKIADLILLDEDPTADINNLLKINMVVNKGHFIQPDSLVIESPENLVQEQLNAYNAHNLDAFLEPYADDIELFNFPDSLLSKGKASMRQKYEWPLSKLPNLHCELAGRLIKGNTIIDHEKVTGIGKEVIEAIVIYKIEGNKIRRVYFIR